MSQEVQIVIVSLCAFINVGNSNNILPPPSLVIPRATRSKKLGGILHPHTAFFAWDPTKTDFISSDGKTGTAVPKGQSGETTSFVYLSIDGDFIEIKNAGSGALDVSGFTGIATSKVWRDPPTPIDYDSNYIPHGLGKMGFPDDAHVAAYMHFGGGGLTAGRATDAKYKWIFKDNRGKTPNGDGPFNREVKYSYPATMINGGKTVLELKLTDLAGVQADRTLTFTAKTVGANLEVFLGNDTLDGMFYDVERKETPAQRESDHFIAMHQMANKGDKTVWPIPKPTAHASARHGGFGGDTTGYCGPTGIP